MGTISDLPVVYVLWLIVIGERNATFVQLALAFWLLQLLHRSTAAAHQKFKLPQKTKPDSETMDAKRASQRSLH